MQQLFRLPVYLWCQQCYLISRYIGRVADYKVVVMSWKVGVVEIPLYGRVM